MEQENVVLSALENTAPEIVGQDWLKNLDRNLIDNLGKYRKYNAASVRDLLRVMRNKVSQKG
jgi:serine/threonine-protein kinase/endoribonuclease IRE1